MSPHDLTRIPYSDIATHLRRCANVCDMPSTSTSVFLDPDTFRLIGQVAQTEGISHAEVVRVACIRSIEAGGPHAQLPERGRTHRLKVRADPVIKAMTKRAALAADIPQSKWIAAAVATHVRGWAERLQEELREDEASREQLAAVQAAIEAGRSEGVL